MVLTNQKHTDTRNSKLYLNPFLFLERDFLLIFNSLFLSMLFESVLLDMGLLLGGIFVVTGLIMYIFPPKKINSLYGYRTTKSMKNQERWGFAQKYAAKVMIVLGVAYIFLLILFSVFDLNKEIQLGIGLGSLLLLAICIFFIVEKKLAKHFE